MRFVSVIVPCCAASFALYLARTVSADNGAFPLSISQNLPTQTEAAMLSHGVWLPIGPGPDTHSHDDPPPEASAWQPLGLFGGDVRAVAVSPTNANIALAGTAAFFATTGVMYRSADSGLTWSPVLSGNVPSSPQGAVLQVFDIEFAPNGTAYAATPDGILESTDAGLSWDRLIPPAVPQIGAGVVMWDVTVDPVNPAILWIGLWDQFALNRQTLWRSDDGGASWVDRTPPLSGTISCHEIVLDPKNTSRVFACFTADNFVHLGLGEVWFSPDDGQTWFDRTSNLPQGPKRDLHYDGNRILVGGDGLDDHNGPLLEAIGLYESTDDGQTWSAMHDASWSTLRVLEIDVDPADPDRILVGTRGHGVIRSIDGGASWRTSVDGTVGSSISALHVAAGKGNRILAGAVGPGALLSEDAGLSFEIASQGMSIVLVRSVAVNPLDSTQFAAAISYQTGGVIASSVNAGLDWTIEPIANTAFSKVAFAPDGLLYALSVGPLSVATDGIYRREQNGTWTHVGLEGVPGGLTAIRFSNNDPNLILAGGGFELALGVNETNAVTIWRSTNGGATWTREFEESRFRETITRIEFVEDGADNVVLATAGSLQPGALGAMLRSVDGGRTWAESRTGLPMNMQAFGLSASSADPRIFYLADLGSDGFGPDGSIYKSVDAGQSWFDTGFGGAAPGSDGGVIDVLCDPVDPNVIYAIKLANIPPFPPPGTAAWISEDAGASYRSFSEGAIPAPPVFLFELAFADGASDQILCATGAGLLTRTVREATPGDLNCDGLVDASDIEPFLIALFDPQSYTKQYPDCDINNADINGDGSIDALDIEPFLNLLFP